MIEYLYDMDEELVSWATARIRERPRFRSDARAIGMSSNGNIRVVTIYDTFSGTDCLMHIATDGGPNWLNRSYIARGFAYPFTQLKLNRTSTLVSSHNRASVQFTLRMGWLHEGTQREAGIYGEDLLLFGMLRRECRWLPPLPETALPV